MTDPAVEAARRAWELRGCGPYVHLRSIYGDMEFDEQVSAAREALAPIRELHKRGLVDNPYYDNEYECVECTAPWPCDTAKLIYTTEELR